jgi:hypothetical protein
MLGALFSVAYEDQSAWKPTQEELDKDDISASRTSCLFTTHRHYKEVVDGQQFIISLRLAFWLVPFAHSHLFVTMLSFTFLMLAFAPLGLASATPLAPRATTCSPPITGKPISFEISTFELFQQDVGDTLRWRTKTNNVGEWILVNRPSGSIGIKWVVACNSPNWMR